MKYNIAICGTFNVDNYGDVMFPVIFKRAMEARNLDVELFLISPGKTTDDTLCPDATVYSVAELDALNEKYGIDTIVVGGGALVHFSKISVKLCADSEFSNYNIYDSWYTPIAFAARNNIKVLFNLPQIPYEIPDELREITRKAFEQADYISLRDKTSAENLANIFEKGMPEINVYPDSVCCIHELVPKDELLQIKKKLLPFDDKYAVIQFNPQKKDSENNTLFEAIKRLQTEGYKIVFLPLGYTHNDDVVLKEYNEKYDNVGYMIGKKLNIFEMAAVLSDCSMYIGASFHGAITAVSYGNVAISYNYICPKTKNREVFEMYGLNDFVAEDAAEVCALLDKYLSGGIKFNPNIVSVVSDVNTHFDRLCENIKKQTNTQRNKYDFYASLIELLPVINTLGVSAKSVEAQLEMTQNHINNLENQIESYKSKCEHSEMEKAEALNAYTNVVNSRFWRLTSPARKCSQVLKNFLKKHKTLFKMVIFCKATLRHGFSAGRQAVNDYKKTLPVDKKLTLKLDKKINRYQKEYQFDKDITFSILVPLYNTPIDFLEQMIDSVQKQTYSKWELCLADGSDAKHNYVEKYCLKAAKKDARIKYSKLKENRGISENTNECLKMAKGEYIALFDHDDVLDPTVLFEYMRVICEQNADFIYCDEDKFNKFGGKLYDAHHKPDFAIDNLRANNYICHFTVFDKALIEKAGAFRKEFDGSQDHDLILRLTEQAKRIVHIPKVLYHWRVSEASVASDPYAKPYTIEAGKKAVAEHLERSGLNGIVESSKIHPNIYRVKYDIVANPLVSIIIPNYNHIEELSRCINSIINKSTYKNYEIIIVENNSDEATFKYYDTLKKYNNIRVVIYKPEGGFNYSAINNFGVQFAKGSHYILLNNDVEIITPEWIEEMLMYSQREDVGAVGAMLYYPNNTIQHAGVTIGVLTLAGHNFKHSHRGDPGYFGRAGFQQNVSAVTAACLMLPAKVYKEVGGLDESFAVAFNDIDFCLRIRKAGYLIAFTPFAELYHYESISRGDDESPEKRERFVSEVERFQARWKNELEAGDPYYNPNLTLDREDFSLK